RAVEQSEYDLVHVVNQDALAELLSLLRPAPKIVATAHGELSEAWTSRNCTAYTAVSRGLATLNQPLTDLEVEVIPNGTDCERFTPAGTMKPGRPIIGWVGRARDVQQKDFPRFTRIAALLKKRGIRLWVADGNAASWADLEGHDCDPIVFERCERVAHEAMPQFYREIAASGGLILLTSRYEGWGLVASEAAAAGATTLAPDVVGLREAILPGETGMLYPVNASDEQVAE